MALFERAQREDGLCSGKAPALAFALHAMLDQEPHAELQPPVSTGKPIARYWSYFSPAPVVVQERDDLRERLLHRLPQPLLREDLSQAADDVTHPLFYHRPTPVGLHHGIGVPRDWGPPYSHADYRSSRDDAACDAGP